MTEFIFNKFDYGYSGMIDLGDDEGDIELDTGAPISVISIPYLLQITGESMYAFRKKIERFTQAHSTLELGVYGSQMNEVRHEFVPYVIKDITICGVWVPFFNYCS